MDKESRRRYLSPSSFAISNLNLDQLATYLAQERIHKGGKRRSARLSSIY